MDEMDERNTKKNRGFIEKSGVREDKKYGGIRMGSQSIRWCTFDTNSAFL